MTKIITLKGSPRESGNSAALADQVSAGAEGARADVESIYLHGMDIQPCDACFFCEGSGICAIEDELRGKQIGIVLTYGDTK
jgi:multimeric flavodoxin WrbA